MSTRKLTNDQKAIAINLAMQVECGIVPAELVLPVFERDKQTALDICSFWYKFNDMTRNALKIITNEKAKQHLAKCFELVAEGYVKEEE